MVSLISKDKNSKILEPSCGKGVFLDVIDDKGFTNLSAYEIDKTLPTRHTSVKYESFVSSPLNETFDVIIGNPPYIRWKNLEPELKEELQQSTLWNTYFNSLCDYLFIFILKSIVQLKDGGELIFICSDYWMNTTHSNTLRNFMIQNGCFEEIYRFKETPIFEKVTASFIIFKYRKEKSKNPSDIKLYSYTGKGIPTSAELADLSCFNVSYIPQFSHNSRWILATQEIQAKLTNFETACLSKSNLFPLKLNRIGDFCTIGNGMVSGLDAAFMIPDSSILNEFERKSIIKVLKAKNLGKYKHINESSYMFIRDNISAEEFIQHYPLQPFATI